MKLVVIEGAGKVKTVEKYLGKGYKVFATKGHIRDLPVKTLAVNVKKNFEPKYEILPDKHQTVEELKRLASKAEKVFLATDPDREGEAISWHIAHVLGIEPSEQCRVVFNEISQKAVQKGLSSPREINVNLVDAQQARRVLDRLVGYKLSPILCKKIRNNLSAGRVQSVTLRLLVDRDREIANFKPEEYWPFFCIVNNSDSVPIKLALATKNGKKLTLKSLEEVNSIIEDLRDKSYIVSKIKKSVTKSHAPAPFITSSMQQDALNKLGMTLQQTSSAAQALYEGVDIKGEGKVALITYIRTDSTRVSPDAQKSAREFILEKYGEKYVPKKPNVYASKKSAQDAHEAIRPITLERTPESVKDSLNPYHYKLYKLIYDRFLASQMSEAKYNSVAVEVTAGNYGFKANGKTPLFKGYTAVYSSFVEDDKAGEEQSAKLPEISDGEIFTLKEYKYEQKFTKPPTRYTEASIVKLMEEKGIGRPATYVPTVTLLLSREYIIKEGKYLKSTPLGGEVTDMLVRYFPEIMDVQFTANMEEKLDDIEFGGKVWQNVVGEFYDGLEDKIAAANGDSFSLKAKDEISDVRCEKCGAFMVIKNGKFGKFLACPNFPKCKNTASLDGGKSFSTPVDTSFSLRPESEKLENQEDRALSATATDSARQPIAVCEKCGKPMVVRTGKYGEFLACSGYPACKNIRNLEKNADGGDYGICPVCGKPLKKVITKRSAFYGCTGYPECDFMSYDIVAKEKCPECGAYMVIKRGKEGEYLRCSNKTCACQKRVDKQ